MSAPTPAEKEYYDWAIGLLIKFREQRFYGTMELKLHEGFITSIFKPVESIHVPRFGEKKEGNSHG